MKSVLCGVVALTTAFAALPAQANSPHGGPFGLELSAGTNFPLDIYARGGVELPGRILASTSFGVMPKAYTDALNAVLLGLKVYDAETGLLLTQSLGTSFVWRAQAGWRPFPSAGFYFLGGYTLVTFGGGIAAAQAVSVATGRTVDPALGGLQLTSRSSLHQLSGEIGWQWWMGPITFAVSLGGFGTVGSTSELTVGGTGDPQVARALAEAGEAYMDDAFRSYVHGATVNFRIGLWLF